MTAESLLTIVFSLALVGLASTLLYHEWRGPEPPPGDRGRRSRRLCGAMLQGLLGLGLLGWVFIDGTREPILFLNVSAVLLVLVILLVVLALYDMKGVNAATRHRKLSLLTQELYGFPLKEMSGREAERIGREALEKVVRTQAWREAQAEKHGNTGQKDS